MRTLIAVALGLALVGCDDSTGPGGVVGTFQLQSVSGDPLPATIIQVGSTYLLEVTAGSATVRSDGTYSSSFTFREDDNGTITTVTETSTGTWVESGNVFTFTDDGDGSTVTGTVSGSTLTITDASDVYVYRR